MAEDIRIEINTDILSHDRDALIVFCNKMYDAPLELDRFQMPGVRFSEDRGLLPVADAAVVHVPQGTYRLNQLQRKPLGQLWVSWSLESDIHYPRINDQVYDLKMTYQRDADVWIPYCRNYGMELLEEIVTPSPAKETGCVVASFISSVIDRSNRLEYLRELSQHINVHHYGRIMKNRTVEKDTGRKTKLEVLRRYKFAIAFENSITPDYVTEKYYDPLLTGTIPIYLGAPNISGYAPGRDCHIDASDFKAPADLARYLQELDQDDSLLERHLKWKKEPLRADFVDQIRSYAELPHPFIQLADLVRQRLGNVDGIVPHKVKGWKPKRSKDVVNLAHKKSRFHITLDSAGQLIWELSNGKRTVAQVQETLKAAYPRAAKLIRQDVVRTLRLLQHHGAIGLN